MADSMIGMRFRHAQEMVQIPIRSGFWMTITEKVDAGYMATIDAEHKHYGLSVWFYTEEEIAACQLYWVGQKADDAG